MSKSLAILDKFEQTLLNLATYLEQQSSSSELDYDKKIALDKEILEGIETLKVLKNITYTVSDEELESTLNLSNTRMQELESIINDINSRLQNGEFKGDRGVSISNVSNQNGSLVITDTENKIYNLGNFQNPNTQKDFIIGNGGVGTQVQNIFTYFKSTNEQLDYPIHIVTNLKDVFKTFCFKFVGHALNASLALDCTLVGYYYGANGLRLVDSTQEYFTAYINSEGYLTIKLTLPNNYYTSFCMSSVNVGNGGLITSQNITKSVLSLEDL